jgi:tetratricopeptide (TPR) repeat protein
MKPGDGIIRCRPLWLCAMIFAAAVAVYLPALPGGFIWDDDANVTARALQSVDGLRRIWFEPGATQQYYPVLHSAFWLEHRLWGDEALGYHLLNVILHATAACLVAYVVQQVWCGSQARRPSPAAWLAAFVFALHPVCVESVAWIAEQKNTLSAVFYLSAALAYLRWAEARAVRVERRRLYWLATGLFALALLSKSVTATLPGALLIVCWWRRGRLLWREDVQPILLWFGMGAAAGLFTAWVEKAMLGAEGSDFRLSFLGRCLLACRVPWFYLGKLLWPAHLNFIYPRWRVNPGEWMQFLLPAATLALLFVLWLLSRRWSRGPLAGVLFFVGSLFPVLGFFNVYSFLFSFVADHFQYLASLGVITLAAGGWNLWRLRAGPADDARTSRVFLPAAVALATVIALGLLTYRQCRLYRDGVTLYRATLSRNPTCWMIEYNLGVTLHRLGREEDALACYEQALRLRPDLPRAQINLGAALVAAGHPSEAVAHYEAAITSCSGDRRLTPLQALAEYNLGGALESMGRSDQAADHYERTLGLKPDFAEAWDCLGILLAKSSRWADAAVCYEKELRLKPDSPGIQYDLAVALRESGHLSESIERFQDALRVKPDYPQAENDLGITLAQSDRLDEAIVHFQAALRIKPDYATAHNNLGLALRALGRGREADLELAEAARLEVLPSR